MAKVLVAPNGLQIQGTLERVHGAGLMTNIRLEDGKIAFDYGGETKMWWEEQRQAVDDKGEPLFVDTERNEWPESQIKLAADQRSATSYVHGLPIRHNEGLKRNQPSNVGMQIVGRSGSPNPLSGPAASDRAVGAADS